jgi:hypothetical protein
MVAVADPQAVAEAHDPQSKYCDVHAFGDGHRPAGAAKNCLNTERLSL